MVGLGRVANYFLRRSNLGAASRQVQRKTEALPLYTGKNFTIVYWKILYCGRTSTTVHSGRNFTSVHSGRRNFIVGERYHIQYTVYVLRKQGLPLYDYVLTPRHGGFNTLVEGLRAEGSSRENLIDVTIAYEDFVHKLGSGKGRGSRMKTLDINFGI